MMLKSGPWKNSLVISILCFTDVYSRQHTGDAAELPRCPHHVLSTQSLGELQQQQQSQHGHLTPSTSGQLGHDPTRAQPAGLMDSGAFPPTSPPSPRLALSCQSASSNRTEGQRRHGGRKMRARTTRPPSHPGSGSVRGARFSLSLAKHGGGESYTKNNQATFTEEDRKPTQR